MPDPLLSDSDPPSDSSARTIDAAHAAAVRAQLERLIASASFRTSKRCQLLLRRVVEQSLHPGATPLTERVLGVEVLGRKPRYDTSADSIVRVTAGEIRRRLGQYYADPAHQAELRIDIPPGRYVATYSWPATPATTTTHGAAEVTTVEPDGARGSAAAGSAVESGMAPHAAGNGAARSDTTHAANAAAASSLSRILSRRSRVIILTGLAGLLLAAVALPLGLMTANERPSATARFWEPLLSAAQPVLVCTGAIDISHVGGKWWRRPQRPMNRRRRVSARRSRPVSRARKARRS